MRRGLVLNKEVCGRYNKWVDARCHLQGHKCT